MSCVIQEIYEWLASAFFPASITLVHAAVFGSVAAGSSHPGDCDVVLVSAADPDSDEWHALRASIMLLRSDFLQHFVIPMSIVLLTLHAWDETQVPLFDLPANKSFQATRKALLRFPSSLKKPRYISMVSLAALGRWRSLSLC